MTKEKGKGTGWDWEIIWMGKREKGTEIIDSFPLTSLLSVSLTSWSLSPGHCLVHEWVKGTVRPGMTVTQDPFLHSLTPYRSPTWLTEFTWHYILSLRSHSLVPSLSILSSSFITSFLIRTEGGEGMEKESPPSQFLVRDVSLSVPCHASHSFSIISETLSYERRWPRDCLWESERWGSEWNDREETLGNEDDRSHCRWPTDSLPLLSLTHFARQHDGVTNERAKDDEGRSHFMSVPRPFQVLM